MLVKHGVYLRTCSDKIGLKGQFIRVASRTKAENNKIIDAFKEEISNNYNPIHETSNTKF